MNNHFHLLVRTPRANLSQFIERLNTSYALYARYKHKYAIASDRFVEETERRLAGLRTGRSQDADLALPRTVWPIADIDAAVAAHFGLDPQELKRHGHCSGLAKFLAVELACRLTGQTQRAIGEHYGGITSAAVSTIRRKIREGKYPLADPAEEMVRQLTRRKVNI